MIIVDNTVSSYYLQMENGVPIFDFEGDPNDRALLHLTVYLKGLLYEQDVREKISVDFGLPKKRALVDSAQSKRASLIDR